VSFISNTPQVAVATGGIQQPGPTLAMPVAPMGYPTSGPTLAMGIQQPAPTLAMAPAQGVAAPAVPAVVAAPPVRPYTLPLKILALSG